MVGKSAHIETSESEKNILTRSRLVSQCKIRVTVKVPRVTGEVCLVDKDTRRMWWNLQKGTSS